MRRFLFLILILLVVLAFGRELTSAALASEGRGASLRIAAGEDRDDWPEEDRREERSRSVRTAPRAHDGEVRFRLPDHGYESVDLVGSFNRWNGQPMQLDADRGVWEITVDVGRGRHEYAFLVRDDDGERRRRDPANPRRVRDEDRNLVSELVIGKDGRVTSSREEGELDLLSEALVDFQRVDGFWLGTSPRYESNAPFSPTLGGRVGYGFASERWSARLDLEQPLTAEGRLNTVLSLYDTTDFTEQTGVGDIENLITSLVVREDNRDYYRREGLALGLAWQPRRRLSLRTEFRTEDHGSLARATRGGWGGRDVFLPNPTIDDATLRSLWTRARWGTSLRHVWLTWEYSHRDLLSTAFDFSQLIGQARTRVQLGRENYLDLRVKAGTNLVGALPAQKRHVLGGIGTVRGYTYQSLLVAADAGPARGGQQMFLANAEYVLGVDDDLQLVLLFDSGMAWEDRDAGFALDDLVSSIGVGIQFDVDTFRIDVVKPLDGDGDVMVQARLNRMF